MKKTQKKPKLRLRVGDQVQVVAGKDKGKQGKITKTLAKTNQVLVEGVNEVKRHVKSDQQNPSGGVITKNMPLHVSNVMILDPKTNKPTRIGRKKVANPKKNAVRKEIWVRASRASDTVLDRVGEK